MKNKIFSLILAFIFIISMAVPSMAQIDINGTKVMEKDSTNILQNQITKAILEQGVKTEKTDKMVELLVISDNKDITRDLMNIGAEVSKKSTSVYVVNIPAKKANLIADIKSIKSIGKDEILSIPKPIDLKEVYKNGEIAYPYLEYSNEDTDISKFWDMGYDGKDTVISIIDTGVEVGNEMLTLTSDGKIKIVDWKDFWHFCGEDSEGDVRLKEIDVQQENDNKFIEVNGSKINLDNSVGNKVLYGLFNESKLKIYGGGNHDVNNNGKFDDKILVLVDNYTGDIKDCRIFVDTNSNNDLTDEKEMSIYKEIVKSFKDKVIFDMENGSPKIKSEYETQYDKLINNFYDFQWGTNQVGARYNFVITEVVQRGGDWIVNLGYDGNSHGTHVAGDAAGNGYVELPFVDKKHSPDGTLKGAAPNAQIIACRVFQSDGGTPSSSYMAAMEYSAENGADVVNMSLGSLPDINDGNSPTSVLMEQLSMKYGIIFAISAGNDGPSTNAIGTPGDSDWAVTVGAYNPAWLNYGAPNMEDSLWYFSGRGPTEDGRLKPTIIAPGSMISSVPMWYVENIRELGKNYIGYARMEGTSMSSPYVAGVIATIKQAINEKQLPYHPLIVKEALFETGNKDINNKMYLPTEIGGGMIDAQKALSYLEDLKTKGLSQEQLINEGRYIGKNSIVLETKFDYSEKLPYRPEGLYVRNGNIPETVNVEIFNNKGIDIEVNFEKDSYNYSNDWLLLSEDSLNISKGESKVLTLTIDKEKLNKGINSVLIKMDDPKTPEKEGFIPLTVINYMDLSVNGAEISEIQSMDFKPGNVDKHFFRAPYGIRKVEIEVKMTDPSDTSNLLPIITAPSGIQAKNVVGVDWLYQPYSNTLTMAINDPEPGTWEIDVFSGIISDPASATGRHKVTVKAKGVVFGPDVIKYGGKSGEYIEEGIDVKLLNATNSEKQSVKLVKTNLVCEKTNRIVERKTIKNGEQNIVTFVIPENDTNILVDIKTRNPQNQDDDLDLSLYRMVQDSQGDHQLSQMIATSGNSNSDEDIYIENLEPGIYGIVIDAYQTAPETTYDLIYQVANSSHGENVVNIINDNITLTRELGNVKIGVRVPPKSGRYIGFISAVDEDKNVLGKLKISATSSGTDNNLSLNYDEIVRCNKEFDITLKGDINESNDLNNIYGVQFELIYDESKISPTEILNGDIFEGTSFKEIQRTFKDDKIVFAAGFLNTEGKSDNMGAIKGDIAKIKMNAKKLGNAQLNFEKILLVNHRGDEIAINTVFEYKLNIADSDVLENGSFDIRDICKLAYNIGKVKDEIGYDVNLDLNNDGTIDYKDLNFLINCFREDY